MFLLLPGGAAAQRPGIQIEPYVGIFVPLADLIDEERTGVRFVASQEEAFALGGRAMLALGGAMGVEGNFLYAWSDVDTVSAGTGSASEQAYTWAADLRLHLTLLPGPVALHLTGGAALVGHGGDAWQDVVDGDWNVAGAGGLGLKLGLGGFVLRGEADVYVYSAELTVRNQQGQDVTFGSEVQADLVFSAGLVLSL
jgi:hypothetical protein